MICNIMFTDEPFFTRDGVNNTRNSHLWDHDNRHGTVESKYQHRFSLNVWCSVMGDQLIGLYIFLNWGCISEYMAARLPEMSYTQPVILAMYWFSLN